MTPSAEPGGTVADVAVIGVGTMGALTAWELSRRGASVLAFEQFSPGHDRAGAGGESRLFRTAYHEGDQYVPLLREARSLWRALEGETGVSLLTVDGGLMIGAEDGAYLRAVSGAVSRHGIRHETLTAGEMASRFPQHRLRDGEIAVLDRESGYLRPELAVLTAARAARSHGATIHTGARVERIEREDEAIAIVTGQHVYRARRAVVSAGVWSDRLLSGMIPRLDVQRLVMTWFGARHPGDFTSPRFPIFLRRSGDIDISGWPSLDGASVKVCINYGWDHVDDPEHLERGVTEAALAPIREAVTECLPGLFPDPLRVGVYMDGYTHDRHGLVGALPEDERIVVLAGFSGHGFKLAPVIGSVAADLVLEGGTARDVSWLAPSRFPAVPTVADRLGLPSAA